MSDTISQITNVVIEGRMKEMAALTQTALDEGISAQDIRDRR
jgi:hypothetical protein